MFQPIHLTVAPDTAQLVPGGQCLLTLTVQNASSFVDRYHIDVGGLPPDWYDLDQTVIPLFPGASARAQLRLHPPAGTTTRAGAYPLTVRAASEDDPALAAELRVELTVEAVGGLSLELQPVRAEGRRATYWVAVRNTANRDATVAVEARDDQGGLVFRREVEGTLSVPAGGESLVELAVEPKVKETIGEPHPYQIECRVRPVGPENGAAGADEDGAPPDPALMRPAVFVYRPRVTALSLPRWLRRLPLWALLLLLLGALLALLGAGSAAARTVLPPPVPHPPRLAPRRLPAPHVPPVPTRLPLPTPRPTPSPPPRHAVAPLPRIGRFTVQPGPGGTARIGWSVAGAESVRLNGQAVGAAGLAALHLTRPTTLVLTATSAGGTVSWVLRVVPQPRPPLFVAARPVTLAVPAIHRFTAHVDPRTHRLVLGWSATGGANVTLNGRPVRPVATTAIAPSGPATYVLRVTNALGAVQRTLVVPARPAGSMVSQVVLRAPNIRRFTLAHRPGQPYALVWRTVGATAVTLDRQAIPPQGRVILSVPLHSHTYVLVASNGAGRATAQVRIVVRAATSPR